MGWLDCLQQSRQNATHNSKCVVHSVLPSKNRFQQTMQTQNAFWVVGDAEGKIASSLGLFASPRNTGMPNRAIERERAKGAGAQSAGGDLGR
jgi:hypothetical protein